MTVKDLMKDKKPDPVFEGYSTADDLVLAVDFSGSVTDVNEYVVAQAGVTESSGALSAQTQENQYLRTGQVSTKTGTSRSFKVTGDCYSGDAFQDALLAHEMKYGTGQAVIKKYAYFNVLTGEGEKGTVSITVEDDLSGGAGDNASFSAALSSTTKPEKYTYEPVTI